MKSYEEIFENNKPAGYPEDKIIRKYDLIVIGGGPAGMMAGIIAGRGGKKVLIIDKNQGFGRKLMITGKGRCNITNACDFETLLASFPGNPKFMYSSLKGFSNYDIIDFFEKLGVKTVTERGQRVFPESQNARTVRDAMTKELKRLRVDMRNSCAVTKIYFDEDDGKKKVKGVLFGENDMEAFAPNVLVATGGITYPVTGSTGDGFAFAKEAGHTVTDLKPALVALVCRERWCGELNGLSLKNVELKLKKDGKTIYTDFGEMVFTLNGISGPIVLSGSRTACEYNFKDIDCFIDLKPALTEEKLFERITRDFAENRGKIYSNALDKLLPAKLIRIIIRLSCIDPQKKVSEISNAEKQKLVKLLKNLKLTVCGSGPLAEAIITAGGIKVSEINPKTMESKLCGGLYFAGEIIDVDGFTGGFNLTEAFSTGYAVGKAVAEKNIIL